MPIEHSRANASPPPKVRLTVLYDGYCRLCINSVNALKKLKTSAELVYIPLQEAAGVAMPEGYTTERLMGGLHVLDDEGRVYAGEEAVFRLLRTTSALGWLHALTVIPGFAPAARVIYRMVAKHRYKLFGKTEECDSGSCSIHHGRKEGGKGKET